MRPHRLKLKQFQKFDSAAVALEEVSALIEGKVTPRLASLLDTLKDEKKASLAVADPKLGKKQQGLGLSPLLTIARDCHQQVTTPLHHSYLGLHHL
jgi:hypothetical protein